MKDLDKTDYKILDVLQNNGRITNLELANRVALSPSSCLQRVRRLEEEGIINGYYAQLNLNAMCHSVVCILNISLKNNSQKELAAFDMKVKSIPEIVEYYAVIGASDAVLKIICRDMQTYLKINEALINSNEYSASISTHVVLKEKKKSIALDLETLKE